MSALFPLAARKTGRGGGTEGAGDDPDFHRAREGQGIYYDLLRITTTFPSLPGLDFHAFLDFLNISLFFLRITMILSGCYYDFIRICPGFKASRGLLGGPRTS